VPERLNPLLRIACIALAGLVFYQLSRLVARKDPLGALNVPAALSAAAAPETQLPKKETNAVPTKRTSKKDADVPPAIQSRVERITQSEILGPVVRPLPMALLGIAGKDAFLRTPDGQTGLLREGDELGGVKLLRIGTNRVLIEHEGQKKELMVFSGFGSETLLESKNPK
jgi:hypothetical protein